MLKILSIIFSLIIGISLSTNAQQFNHYYLNLDAQDYHQDVEYGKVIYDSTGIPYKCTIDSLDQAKLLNTIIDHENTDLYIYIHGMWSNKNRYWSRSVKKLTHGVFRNDTINVCVLSVIWSAALFYPASVKKADRSGQILTPFLVNLLNCNDSFRSINVIAHSMGNRVWQSMVQPLIPNDFIAISTYFALGADLPADIFDNHGSLHHIESLCNKIIVYKHNNDRTLITSQVINKDFRLGVKGLSDQLDNSDSYIEIDVSIIDDYDQNSDKILHHKYYYTSNSVMADIKYWLANKNNPNRKKLRYNNYLLINATK